MNNILVTNLLWAGYNSPPKAFVSVVVPYSSVPHMYITLQPRRRQYRAKTSALTTPVFKYITFNLLTTTQSQCSFISEFKDIFNILFIIGLKMRVKLNATMFLIIIFLKKISSLLNATIMTLNAIIQKKKSLFWSHEVSHP